MSYCLSAHFGREAVLKAFKNLARFRQEAKFSIWLIQICINKAKMRLRKDRCHLYESINQGPRNDDGNYIPKDFADWREIPSETLGKHELREALVQAFKSLPEKYRTIMILRNVQHLNINETAQLLGISEANVKTRLCRARLQMRDALAPGPDGAWFRERSPEKNRPVRDFFRKSATNDVTWYQTDPGCLPGLKHSRAIHSATIARKSPVRLATKSYELEQSNLPSRPVVDKSA